MEHQNIFSLGPNQQGGYTQYQAMPYQQQQQQQQPMNMYQEQGAMMAQRATGGMGGGQWVVAHNNTPIGYSVGGQAAVPRGMAPNPYAYGNYNNNNNNNTNNNPSGFKRGGHKGAAQDAEGPTTFANLFVSRLPDGITHEDLLQIFAEYKPSSATVMTDHKTGRSKGFGFIQFGSEEDGKNAHHTLHQMQVTVRKISFIIRAFPSKHDANQSVEVSPVLYVRNVPKAVPKVEVEKMLESLGSVVFCAMREEPDGLPVWVVLVEYDCQQCADNALSHLRINTSLYPNHRAVIAKYAKPMDRKRHDPKPDAVPCPFKHGLGPTAHTAPEVDAFPPHQNGASASSFAITSNPPAREAQVVAPVQPQSTLTSPYVFPTSPNLMRPGGPEPLPTMLIPSTQTIAAHWAETELQGHSEIKLPGFSGVDDDSSPLNTGLSKKAKGQAQPMYQRPRTDSRASSASDTSRVATGFNSSSYSFHSGAPLSNVAAAGSHIQAPHLSAPSLAHHGPYFVVVDNGNRHSISLMDAGLGNSGVGNSLAVNGTLSPTIFQQAQSQSQLHYGAADIYGPIGRDSDSSGPASRANSFSFSQPPPMTVFGAHSSSGITSPPIHHYVPFSGNGGPNPQLLPQPTSNLMPQLLVTPAQYQPAPTAGTPVGHSSSLSGSQHNGNSGCSGSQPTLPMQAQPMPQAQAITGQQAYYYPSGQPQMQQQQQQQQVYPIGYPPHQGQGMPMPLHYFQQGSIL